MKATFKYSQTESLWLVERFTLFFFSLSRSQLWFETTNKRKHRHTGRCRCWHVTFVCSGVKVKIKPFLERNIKVCLDTETDSVREQNRIWFLKQVHFKFQNCYKKGTVFSFQLNFDQAMAGYILKLLFWKRTDLKPVKNKQLWPSNF